MTNRTSHFIALAATALLLIYISRIANAHDYWLLPQQFKVENDLMFRAKMAFGSNFKPKDAKPLWVDLTKTLQVHSNGKPIIDLLKIKPAPATDAYTDVKVQGPGSYWFTSERDYAYIELKPEKFEKYLQHENLPQAIEERRKRNESDKVGRERYTRSLKSYVSVGQHQDDETWKMRIPQRVEINPLANPNGVTKGQNLSFEIRVLGNLKEGLKVSAMHVMKNGETKNLTATTDKKGRVTFRFTEVGPWLVRTVHIQRCESCKKVEWESFWGALTFGIGPKI